MSAVVIEGGIVHYESLGRGKPIIFLHGWLGSWRYWMSTMGELSDAYRTYALDLWGFGDSDKSRPRYAIRDHVNLLAAFFEELGIRKAPLIGHALGAVVALEFALLKPERVDRLAVVSMPLSGADVNAKAFAAGKASLGAGLFGQPQEYAPVIAEMDKADKTAFEVSLESLGAGDLAARMALLNVPALLVHGAKDTLVNPPKEEFFNTAMSSAAPSSLVRTMLFEQSRHFPMLEDEASGFNRLLRDFLTLDISDPATLYSLELKEEWRRRYR